MKAEKTRRLIEKLIFPNKLSGFIMGTYKEIDDELNKLERFSEMGRAVYLAYQNGKTPYMVGGRFRIDFNEGTTQHVSYDLIEWAKTRLDWSYND